MRGQTALEVLLGDGAARLVEHDLSAEVGFVGALAAAIGVATVAEADADAETTTEADADADAEADADADADAIADSATDGATAVAEQACMVLGVGPLAATPVPGASELALALRAPAGRVELCALPSVGFAFDGLGVTPLTLRGRVERPSILRVARVGGALKATLYPCDDVRRLWRAGGVEALATHVAKAAGGGLRGGAMLLCGAAAADGELGALVCCTLAEGAAGAPLAATAWGGFGSALLREHGLVALVFGSDRDRDALLARAGAQPFLDVFSSDMTVGALEWALDVHFDDGLVHEGAITAALRARGRDGLWLNGRTALMSRDERERYYDAIRAGLAEPLALDADRMRRPVADLGSPRRVDGVALDVESTLALGPALGVLAPRQVARLRRRCFALGVETRSFSMIAGWLLDEISEGALRPQAVGLDSAPRWPRPREPIAVDQMVAAASHNASLVENLLAAIGVDTTTVDAASADNRADADAATSWPAAARRGLSALVESLGASFERALWRPRRAGAAQAAEPWWSVAAVAPLPAVPSVSLASSAATSPRATGHEAALRCADALMLCSLGVSPTQRAWARAHFVDFVDRCYGTRSDEREAHRRLLRHWQQISPPRFWASQRVSDVIERRLQASDHDGNSAAAVDSWLARFARDRAGAARSAWSELCAGVVDALA